MGRQRAARDLALPPRRGAAPAYRWLYAGLRAAILDGRLRPGARLPATRELAEQYRLSRGTVVNAFDMLAAEGYIRGTVGSGTYVNLTLPETRTPVRVSRAPTAAPSSALGNLSHYSSRLRPWPGTEARAIRAFRANIPAVDLFPMSLWTQITARRLRRASRALLVGGAAPGYPPLRTAVADYLNASRGVRCVAEQVVIVSGVQEALDLSARLLLNEGNRVAMENPGYPGASLVFAAIGASLAPIPVDDEGAMIDPSRLRHCRMIYVTPAHQFPLGTTMSLARRFALLDWARKNNAMIFEDDYDSEFRYAGRPVPALQGLDDHNVVLFAGSFNKVLFPSLRLAYLVVPLDFVDRVAAAKSLLNRHQPVLEQTVLAEFISDGHFGRHLRRMREVYAERLSALADASRARLAGLLDVSDVEAGIQTVGWLRSGITAGTAAAAARQRQVEVIPLDEFWDGPPQRQGLLLGFAAFDLPEIRRGVRDLALALEQHG